MTATPEQPPQITHGGAAAPAKRRLVSFDSSQELRVAVTVGVAFLSAATAIAATYARQDGDLDTTHFTIGVVASVVMLGFAALAKAIVPDAEKHTLVSWPGAAGTIGVALMVSILIEDDKTSQYTSSLVLIGLSVLGYLATRSWPFVLTALAGLVIFYVRAFVDVIDLGDGSGNNTFMVVGAGVVVFVLAVTALGWFLPDTRVLTGVVAGIGAVFAIAVILQFTMVFRTFAAFSDASITMPGDDLSGDFSGDSFPDDGFPDISSVMHNNPYTNDIYVVLAYAGLLAAFWGLCALATGHLGFRLLMIAMVVLTLPMATMALATAHPTWWGIGAGAFGALVLAGTFFLAPKLKQETYTPPSV